jgi:dolichol-phosphate mannosyltransferase
MKLSIIVPCYNEADNIQKIHDELLPVIEGMVAGGWHDESKEIHSAEIIFVDDGSGDETFSKLKEGFSGQNKSAVVAFKFLKHETNLGLGAAIRTGFSKADGDIVITVDSDGTYKFSEIPNFLTFLTPGVDIVTASPYHPSGGVVGVPANRLFLSKGSSFLYRILVDRHVYTYTCLFRAYRSDVIKNIAFNSNGFLAGTEVLVKAILKGYHVTEFPAVLHRRMYGVSKARIAETIFAHLRFQGQIFLYRLQLMFGRKSNQVI